MIIRKLIFLSLSLCVISLLYSFCSQGYFMVQNGYYGSTHHFYIPGSRKEESGKDERTATLFKGAFYNNFHIDVIGQSNIMVRCSHIASREEGVWGHLSGNIAILIKVRALFPWKKEKREIGRELTVSVETNKLIVGHQPLTSCESKLFLWSGLDELCPQRHTPYTLGNPFSVQGCQDRFTNTDNTLKQKVVSS